MTSHAREGTTSTAATSGGSPLGIGERELLTMISAIMALMAIAIDMMLPAFDDLRDAFGLAPESPRISQVITAFFLGLAVAQILWGPLTDRFGRKPILRIGIAIYAFAAIASILAPNLEMLLASRFLWGIGAAASRVVATSVVRDVFEGPMMAKALSQIMAVFVMAPVFAPALGAGLLTIFSWEAVFICCAVWAGLIMLWARRLPETLAPQHRRSIEPRSVASGFGQVLRHPVTMGYTGATVFLQGVFTAYLGSSEAMITDILGRSTAEFPLVFGATAVLFGLGALLNGSLVARVGIDRMINLALGAAIALSLLLLFIAMNGDGVPNFWVFIPATGFMLGTFMLLMPNLNTGALTPMGELAGTAASLTGGVRIGIGALLGAIVDARLGGSVTPFAFASLIFICLAIVCVKVARGLEQRASSGRESVAAH